MDSITWIERQRFLIDTERHAQTVKWHQSKLRTMETKLQDIAAADGWSVKTDDEGKVLAHSVFNVNSNPQIAQLLFDIRKMKVVKKTPKGNASVDADAMKDLAKLYPDDPFLSEYANYKEYVALHPENLRYEPKDRSVRVYFRQNVVAGGRLAAQGGEFDVDGGFGLNPQGIKKPENNWSVFGRILVPDSVPESEVEPHQESELHPSCFRQGKKAKHIINNHIANYLGYSICLVPSCTTCADRFGILIENGHLDSNEVLNLRCLFVAPEGWTMFSVDYSNIEMRTAANCSGEPEFIKEFLEGEGDFHSLTASKVFPEFNDPNTTKERRKYLRGIAKILNFSLLYGGTEHTIFENLKKIDSDITIEKCRDYYQKYWEGVPVFFRYCENKKREAREGPAPSNEPKWDPSTVYHHGDIVQYDPTGRYGSGFGRVNEHAVYVCLAKDAEGVRGGGEPGNDNPNWIRFMRCVTAIGRVVSFVSAMEAFGIHFPTPGENSNYKQYRRYKELAETAHDEGKKEDEKQLQAFAQKLWENTETGVKNVINWKKFYGKIQRVAVNTPLQGLAGDFMRMSLNKICEFATVREPEVQAIFRLHATVHDEIDFIVKNEYVPYVLPRITRLMKLRRLHAAMKWPVPIECDIEYGRSWDVEHHVTGDKDHKPMAWTKVKGLERYVPEEFQASLPSLLAAIESGDEARVAKAKSWLLHNITARAHNAVEVVFKAADHGSRLEALTVTFQLHEYWTVDAVADADEKALEGFEAWEARSGLGPACRDPKCPPFGYLGAIPFGEHIIRPVLEPLNESEPPQDCVTVAVMSEAQTIEAAPLDAPQPQQMRFEAVPALVPVVLRALSPADRDRLYEALGKGRGDHEIAVNYRGKVGIIKGCAADAIPDEFLESLESKVS